jgi:hypothetical protein
MPPNLQCVTQQDAARVSFTFLTCRTSCTPLGDRTKRQRTGAASMPLRDAGMRFQAGVAVGAASYGVTRCYGPNSTQGRQCRTCSGTLDKRKREDGPSGIGSFVRSALQLSLCPGCGRQVKVCRAGRVFYETAQNSADYERERTRRMASGSRSGLLDENSASSRRSFTYSRWRSWASGTAAGARASVACTRTCTRTRNRSRTCTCTRTCTRTCPCARTSKDICDQKSLTATPQNLQTRPLCNRHCRARTILPSYWSTVMET